MVGSKFKVDIKRFVSAKQIENLTQNLGVYEQRLKKAVEDLNLKSRDARAKSRVHIDKFATQLKKTQDDLHKQIRNLVHEEGKVLNQRLADLVQYLKSVAYQEPKGPAKKEAADKKETKKAAASLGETSDRPKRAKRTAKTNKTAKAKGSASEASTQN